MLKVPPLGVIVPNRGMPTDKPQIDGVLMCFIDRASKKDADTYFQHGSDDVFRVISRFPTLLACSFLGVAIIRCRPNSVLKPSMVSGEEKSIFGMG